MTQFDPSFLVTGMDPENIRVHPPSRVIFLCGGAIESPPTPPKMLRDAFYRLTQIVKPHYKIVLAEDAKPLTPDAGYKDLFLFESDIAQIVGLILLFVESPGSFAELGAFSALDSVAPKLLAVIHDKFYNEISFIRDGPIRFLESKHGEEWVLALDRNQLCITDDGSISNLSLPDFSESVGNAISERLDNLDAWTKFDRKNNGHAILLITGLCQEFGALTMNEIKKYLAILQVREVRFENYVYCAELLGWLRRIKKGHHIFYVGMPGEQAIEYKIVDTTGIRDKIRWRADIRDHWKRNDSLRFRVITEILSSSSSHP